MFNHVRLALCMLCASLIGCSRPCTEIGCVDGLHIQYDVPTTYDVYLTLTGVDGQSTNYECGTNLEPCPTFETFNDFQVATAAVRILNVDGEEVKNYVEPIAYEIHQPNGKGCDPVCEAAGLLVTLNQ